MEMHKISIIMPVRNALPFLEECLQSIVNQTYSNWELIAVNDHSSDDSEAILEKFSISDKRIQFIQNKGRGIIDALTTGYAGARGQLISRMDADDIMPKDKLKILSSLLILNGLKHLSTGKVKYISQNVLGDGFKKYEQWLNKLCDTQSHYKDIYKECVIPSPCWMMYKQDFDSIGGFSSKQYPEDYDLCFRMYANQIKVVASVEILHCWRDHEERASRNDENYSDNRFLEMKVKYFLEIDYKNNDRLVVWGAGKKGKKIAQLLLQNKIEFDWVTNNTKKIGKHIYDQKISDQKALDASAKLSIIIAVANTDEQKEIRKTINTLNLGKSIFYFC